jgi:Na+/H+ antiporter NhaD/arsenite permease-like protein
MIGLAIRTLVIILLLAQAPPHTVRYAVIVCTAVTTVCGMWLAYGEPPNLIMKANLINPASGTPYLTDGFFLMYCLPAAVLTYGCVAWSLRQEIGDLRVDLATLDVLDANAASVRFLQALRHGEVLQPVEFAEAHAAELGSHAAAVVERTRTGEALGLALVHAGVAQPLRRLLLGRFIDESLADALDRHYVLESQNMSPGLDEGEVVIARALAQLDKRRIMARRIGLLAALPFGGLLVAHALNHQLPIFLASFAGFAVALAAIWSLPKMRAAALRTAWVEFSEYLFLLPLFFSISLLTRSEFFGQFQQLIQSGSSAMGPASMALAQFFGSSVLSALLDNNVVADFAARAIQGLPPVLILLFSMSQIAGYALGGCWTHIGSAQSVVAYAFIRRDLDPRFGPLQYVRVFSPLLATMAVVLTLYIIVVAYVTTGG